MDPEAPIPTRTSSADKQQSQDGGSTTNTAIAQPCDPYLTFSTLPAEFTLNSKVLYRLWV